MIHVAAQLIRDAVERYVTDETMEVCGHAILKASGRDWSGTKYGKHEVVGQRYSAISAVTRFKKLNQKTAPE